MLSGEQLQNKSILNMCKKVTIEECIKQIKERVEEIPLIIRKKLDNSKQSKSEYYDSRVRLSPNGVNINDEYLTYDIFARYQPQSEVVYLDNIFLRLDQLDNDEELVKAINTWFADFLKKKEDE